MGSDLYEVRVTAKKANTLSLEVRVVHGDSMSIPADRSFALMVLHDGQRRTT